MFATEGTPRRSEGGAMKRKLVCAGVGILTALAMWPGPVASAGACPIPLPQGSEPVDLHPEDFVSQIDNQYWPMAPGTKWVSRELDKKGNAQKVTVKVTKRTKEILGINATVVHDVVSDHGELIENTFDWYAQDVCGNIWYLGENTKEYENGEVVSTEGSWEAGVDGAYAGVIVPADPQVGLSYRQEYYAGQAEDRAAILSLDEQVQVPYAHFTDVLLTKEFTPLEPKVLEYKFYVKGIGPTLALTVSGGAGREELIRFKLPK
jgi:hypothetical protein